MIRCRLLRVLSVLSLIVCMVSLAFWVWAGRINDWVQEVCGRHVIDPDGSLLC